MEPIAPVHDIMSVLCAFLPFESTSRLAAAAHGQLAGADFQSTIASSVKAWTARQGNRAEFARDDSLQAFAQAVPARIALAMNAATRECVTSALLAQLHHNRKHQELRCGAAKALGWHGAQGSSEVVSVLARLVRVERKDAEENSVCAAAAVSLGRVAGAGCVAATDVLLKALLNASASTTLRTATESALSCIVTSEMSSLTARLTRAA